MDELRIRVKNLLIESKRNMTVPQMCLMLNVEDEFDVLSAIADLEYTNKVVMKSMKKFYRPDGCAGYLAEYGSVR